MTKGEDGVYTGVLTLPKGTIFKLKVMKSTVEGTSGGVNIWSAASYSSVLNSHGAYDFGEFTNNLIPNGNFDEGKVKWTPAEAIVQTSTVNSVPNSLKLGGGTGITSCSSDVFTIPPGQTLRLSGYVNTFSSPIEGAVEMKIVTPQHQTLFKCSVKGEGDGTTWRQFSKTFKSMDVPTERLITLSNSNVGGTWQKQVLFDSLSLVNP